MGRTRHIDISDQDMPKKRGRMTGAKTYNKPTLYKLVAQFKPTNMVLWSTIAEQYRISCGELEARPAAVIKRFWVQKMCNSMRKPTGSSGVDDITAKCQHLNRTFHQIEEGDTFGDSDSELEAYPEAANSSDSDSTVEDPDEDHMEEDSENIHTPTVAVQKTKNSVVPSTITESTTSRLSKIIMEGSKGDTKSKNAKPNPTSRLNVGKWY